LNTRLSKCSLLRLQILCSPITQRMESTILLLPHPFGPIIPVIPSSKLTTVLSAKLLNPLISKLFSLTVSFFSQATNIMFGEVGLCTSFQHFQLFNSWGSYFKVDSWLLTVDRSLIPFKNRLKAKNDKNFIINFWVNHHHWESHFGKFIFKKLIFI
jgi:hypothetical protein